MLEVNNIRSSLLNNGGSCVRKGPMYSATNSSNNPTCAFSVSNSSCTSLSLVDTAKTKQKKKRTKQNKQKHGSQPRIRSQGIRVKRDSLFLHASPFALLPLLMAVTVAVVAVLLLLCGLPLTLLLFASIVLKSLSLRTKQHNPFRFKTFFFAFFI